MSLQQQKLTGQDQQFEQLWCLMYIYLPATDNDRTCSSSSKAGDFNKRRPHTSASASSLLKYQPKEIVQLEMYLLYVTDAHIFSTQMMNVGKQ